MAKWRFVVRRAAALRLRLDEAEVSWPPLLRRGRVPEQVRGARLVDRRGVSLRAERDRKAGARPAVSHALAVRPDQERAGCSPRRSLLGSRTPQRATPSARVGWFALCGANRRAALARFDVDFALSLRKGVIGPRVIEQAVLAANDACQDQRALLRNEPPRRTAWLAFVLMDRRRRVGLR